MRLRAQWPPMRFDRPLQVGARGGHGPIRYRVTEYEPGRRVVFRFESPTPLDGWHGFELTETGSEQTRLRHLIAVRPYIWMVVLWPIAFRWFHDAVIEDALHRAAVATGDVSAAPPRWSPWVRILRRIAVGILGDPSAVSRGRDST